MKANIYNVEYNFERENNSKISCFDWFVDCFSRQAWEPETFDTFNYVKDINTVALDIGAWIGPTTVWLSKNFKNVIAIEADPVAYEALTANLSTSNCDNVTVINQPIFSKKDNVIFGVNQFDGGLANSGLGASTSQIKSSSTDLSDSTKTTITLNCIKKYSDYNNISFIKVDIEGGEEHILEQLLTLSKERRWRLYISFHYTWWSEKNIERIEPLLSDAQIIKPNSINHVSISGKELISYIVKNPFASVYIEY